MPGSPDSDARESVARIRTIGRFVVGWAKAPIAKATRKQAAKHVRGSKRGERIIFIQLKLFSSLMPAWFMIVSQPKLLHGIRRKSRWAMPGLLRRAHGGLESHPSGGSASSQAQRPKIFTSPCVFGVREQSKARNSATASWSAAVFSRFLL